MQRSGSARNPGLEIKIYREDDREVADPYSRGGTHHHPSRDLPAPPLVPSDQSPSKSLQGRSSSAGSFNLESTQMVERKKSFNPSPKNRRKILDDASPKQQQAPDGDFLVLLFLTGQDTADADALQKKMEMMESEEVAALRREMGNMASTVVSRAFRKTIQDEKLRKLRREQEAERIEELAHKSVLRLQSNEIMMGASLLASSSGLNLNRMQGVASVASISSANMTSRRYRTERRKSLCSPGIQQRNQSSAIVDAAAQGNAKVLAELLRDRQRPQELLSRASKGSHRRLINPKGGPNNASGRRLSLEESVEQMRHESLNLPDVTGKTPLQAALDRQSWPCVRLLLAEPDVDPSVGDRDGNQPLHSFLAAPGIHKHRDILRSLLRNAMVSVNSRNLAGVTPLMCAAANAELAEAEAAPAPHRAPSPTQRGAGGGEEGGGAEEGRRRSSHGSGSVVREASADSQGGGRERELKPILVVLLEAGARAEDADSGGRRAADHAAMAGAEQHLRLLAARCEGPEAWREQAESALLWLVSKAGPASVACLELLVREAGARVVQGPESALTRAARHNQPACLAALLPGLPSAALEHRDAAGATCLHAAVAAGHNACARQILQALFRAAAPPPARKRAAARQQQQQQQQQQQGGGEGMGAAAKAAALAGVVDAALFLAAARAKNWEMMVEVVGLCPHLKDLRIPAGPGDTRTSLLSWAIRTHTVPVVRVLMESGADVNQADEGGEEESPLMIAVQSLSQSTWAGLAMESLEKGQDEPYISLRDVVQVVQLTKPEACALADSLRDLRGNPLRSPTGRQLFNHNPWRFSWHGFMAVCRAASPDLGKQIAAYSAELQDHMHIFELIMKSGRADMNQECGGRTAAAVAAAGANWRVFEDLRGAGARLGHWSVVRATATHNHPAQLAQCLESVKEDEEASGLTEAVCKEILDETCAGGHVHCAMLLYDFTQTRPGWCMAMDEQLMDAVRKQHYWMVDFLVSKGVAAETQGAALLLAAEHGDFRTVRKLLDASTDPDFTLQGRSALSIAGARWGRSGSPGHLEILVDLLRGNENVGRRGANAAQQDAHGKTVLMWAAAQGHSKLLRLAVSAAAAGKPRAAALPALLDKQDTDGHTALMFAAMASDAGCVGLLLEYGANPDLTSLPGPRGSPPPMTALALVTSQCSRTWPPFLTDLVRETSELAVQDAKGDSFVVWAARWGHTEGMRVAMEGREHKRLALHAPARPSALELAVMSRHREIVLLLLCCWDRNNPGPDAEREGAYVGLGVLTRAVENEWPEVLEAVVQRAPNLDPRHPAVRAALHSCIERRWLRGLRGLLERGVAPDALHPLEPPPLLEACKLDQPRQVQALLNAGAGGMEAAVVVALWLGHMECFRQLWRQVPKTPDLLRAAACMAALANRFDALKTVMLAAKSDPQKDHMHIYGRKMGVIMAGWVAPRVMHRLSPMLFQLIETTDPSVPLLCAVSKSNFRCSSYLLECKADPLVKDDSNLSPIQWACAVGNLDIVKVLVKYGAPVSLEGGQTSHSFSDLRKAYQLNTIQEARRYLSRQHALRSATDNAYKIQLSVSPLLAALLQGHRDVARLLLEAGADPGELKGWCEAALAAEPRLEPTVRVMLQTVLELEDFKAYGPFGIAGPEVNHIDANQIPVSGRLRSVMVQFSESNWELVAIQFIHEVDGKLVECPVHKTTAPHAGEFKGCDRFKHLERLDLEEKEYIIQAEVAISKECVAGLRFTTNYRVCKWLGEEAAEGSEHRLVTISPQGRELVGLFSAVYDRFYLVGFITRLRMGDVSHRPAAPSLKKHADSRIKQ